MPCGCNTASDTRTKTQAYNLYDFYQPYAYRQNPYLLQLDR
jgi:hypothetical protein